MVNDTEDTRKDAPEEADRRKTDQPGNDVPRRAAQGTRPERQQGETARDEAGVSPDAPSGPDPDGTAAAPGVGDGPRVPWKDRQGGQRSEKGAGRNRQGGAGREPGAGRAREQGDTASDDTQRSTVAPDDAARGILPGDSAAEGGAPAPRGNAARDDAAGRRKGKDGKAGGGQGQKRGDGQAGDGQAGGGQSGGGQAGSGQGRGRPGVSQDARAAARRKLVGERGSGEPAAEGAAPAGKPGGPAPSPTAGSATPGRERPGISPRPGPGTDNWDEIRQQIAARRQAELRAREEERAAAAAAAAAGPAAPAEAADDSPPVSGAGSTAPRRTYDDDEDDDDDDLPRPRVTAERRDLTVVRDKPLTTPLETGVGAPVKPRNKMRNKKPPAGRRPRRTPAWLLPLSFLLLVVLPGAVVVNYLYEKAADQYHSIVAFSVRSEETPSVSDIGGVSLPSVTGPSDSDILYQFIQSQQMVQTLDKDLDLRTIYNKRPDDEVFSFGTDHSIEDLVDYWNWATTVDYDATTGLIEVTALAFTPEDARNIAQGVLDESSKLVNSLSTQAREDAISYARTDVEEAQARLREIRLKLREFRDKMQTADPTQDVAVQMALLTALQQNLAEALIDRAELTEVTRQNDPRIAQADRRIRAVEEQISAEKAKIGNTSEDPDRDIPLASTVGEFEELKTDLGFAEEAYVTAQKAFDEARIEARRQSRYLAPHIQPTFSQEPQYPQRLLLSFLAVGALTAFWGVLMLLVVNISDRR
ncbi:hypothetical protein FDP22_07025 [Paroceanicella profunda]|uniref:Sugar transporter n=1 Tax=Paroceanicella profunda TaxID=2579971 RepID=A0A5B8FGY4_9RHOB|nr:hypothetical protein [Paroceanicella profunda]QDL91557.1 hypothetical protein FDP22_07025 [Paroceanicella profunda]